MTFDADGTLYADGTHMNHDNEMINHMITLMEREVGNFFPMCTFRAYSLHETTQALYLFSSTQKDQELKGKGGGGVATKAYI